MDANQESKSRVKIFLPLMFAVVLVIGMFIGFKFYESFFGKPNFSADKSSYSKVADVLRYLDVKYVDTINKTQLSEAAINQILQDLDPHSHYIPVSQLQRVNESLKGNFEGIGIEFFLLEDTITVVSPITGGPSEALGIRAGDKIVEIESEVVAGVDITNKDVIDKLRGEKGTKVNIKIYRKGQADLISYTITRDKIPVTSVDVSYMIDDEIGYLKINRFSDKTYEEFLNHIQGLLAQNMQKLILDLRGNPGGYLHAAVSIVDELLNERKLIVYTEGRTYSRDDHYTQTSGQFEQGDLAILIDHGSASASEIVAGAIQDWDRGVIIGRRSFGKGLVQEQFMLPDGSALRMTVSKYYTPSERSIQKSYDAGYEAYNKELFERIEAGELSNQDSMKVDDSLKYFTSGRRVVYGGGGITPDIFIPLDTVGNNAFVNKVIGSDVIREFAFQYLDAHSDQLAEFNNVGEFKEGFTLNDTDLDDLRTMISNKDFDVNEMDEKAQNTLVIRIRATIARQLWKDAGYYPIIFEIDQDLQKAHSMLKENSVREIIFSESTSSQVPQ